jgi:hypothetical protein
MSEIAHVLDVVVDVVAIVLFVGFGAGALCAAWMIRTWGKGKT